VRTICITAPQQAQTMGARSLTHAEARGGTNFIHQAVDAVDGVMLPITGGSS
jgi:hypothetical protein